MALSPTELYVEEGYLLDADYVGGIADATVGITPYVEEGYIEDGYVEGSGAQFSLVAELSLAIQYGEASISAAASMTVVTGTLHNADAAINAVATQTTGVGAIRSGSAEFTGAFTPSMTAVATKTGDILGQSAFVLSATGNVSIEAESLLEYIADLNAQAARTRDIDAQFAAEFAAGHYDAEIGFSNDILPAVDFNAAADLTSAFGFAAEGLNVQFGEATISSEFAATASPIEYILRENQTPVPGVRPHYPTDNGQNGVSDFTTGVFGNAVQLYGSANLSSNEYVTYTLGIDDIGNPDTNSSFQLDVWMKFSGKIQAWTSSGTPSWSVWKTSTNNIFFYLINSNNNTNNRLDGAGTSGFDHVSIRVDNSAFSLWINGTRVDTYAGNLTNAAESDVMYLTFGWDENFESSFPSNSAFQIDEFRILRGTETQLNTATGYSVNSTSISVPTSEYSNNPYTKILLHFNDNLKDDTANLTLDFAANPTGVFDQTATITGQVFASVNMEAIYTELAVAAKIGDFFVDADSQFDFVADGELIKSTAATIASAATANVSISVTRDGSASAGVEASAVIINSRTRTDSLDVSSAFSATIVGVNTTDTNVELSSEFAANIVNSRTRADSADISSAGSVEVTGFNIVDGAADITTAFNLTTAGSRIRFIDTEFSSIASQLTAAVKIGDFFVDADSQFVAVIDAVVKTGSVVSVIASSTAETSVDRIRPGSSTQESAFVWSSIPEASKTADASASSAVSMAITGALTASGSSTLAAAASTVAEVDKLRRFGSDMASEFGINCTAAKTVDINSNISVEFASEVTGNKTADAVAELLGFAAIVSVNRILHPEQYLHMVVSENRTYRIPAETRTHMVVSENRTYSIQGT